MHGFGLIPYLFTIKSVLLSANSDMLYLLITSQAFYICVTLLICLILHVLYQDFKTVIIVCLVSLYCG